MQIYNTCARACACVCMCVWDYASKTVVLSIPSTHIYTLPVYCNLFILTILLIYIFNYPIIWYNNKTINSYFNCNEESSISVHLFYIIVTLPDDDCNYHLKHVIVSTMSTFVFLWYSNRCLQAEYNHWM